MSDWVSLAIMFAQGLFCYWIGYRAGAKDAADEFKPTQETWLELEKFRWTHEMNVLPNDDEEE